YTGKTVWGLTKEINKYLFDEIGLFTLETFAEMVRYFPHDEDLSTSDINIEDLLSKAESAKEYIPIDDGEEEMFNETLKSIEDKIKELCTLQLHRLHPHPRFLEKITTRRKSHNRVKLFTTNYDTLFEEAAQQEGFILVDGFTYDLPRKFNPFMFDYD